MICPSCCAQIRNPDCVGCGYYAQADKYAKEKSKSIKKTSQSFIMRIDPDVDEAVDQALAMVEQGRIQAGKQAISELLETHPDIHTVQYAMGTISGLEGQHDKALELDPNYEPALLNRELLTNLKEGEKLSLTQLGYVEYYKDHSGKKKLFRRVFG